MCTWAQMHAHSMCANIKGSPPESSSPAVRMGCQNPASAQAPISTGVYSRRCWWVFCWDIVYESLASCYLGGHDPSPGKWVNIKEDLWQQVPLQTSFPASHLGIRGSDCRLVTWNLAHPRKAVRTDTTSATRALMLSSETSLCFLSLMPSPALFLETSLYVVSLFTALISFLINPILSGNLFHCPYLIPVPRDKTFYLSYGFWRLNSSHQVFQQVRLSTVPLCQSSVYFECLSLKYEWIAIVWLKETFNLNLENLLGSFSRGGQLH